jgi:hypothetical protein
VQWVDQHVACLAPCVLSKEMQMMHHSIRRAFNSISHAGQAAGCSVVADFGCEAALRWGPEAVALGGVLRQ